MYGALVSEEFCFKFSEITTAVSITSNLLLIFILAKTHISHVGPYRYLLLLFAIVDILVSLTHLLFIPAIHMGEFGYIYWSYRFLHEGTTAGTAAGVIFVLLFYQTFALLSFHYVYRYVTVCNPPWLSWMHLRPWRNWLAAGIVADFVVVGAMFFACCAGFLPNEASRKVYAPILKTMYNIDLLTPDKPGYLANVFWTLDESGGKVWIAWSLFIIGFACLIFFSTASVMVGCTMGIMRNLNESSLSASTTMAPKTKRMQRQLFRALIWQTIIPCITSYAPVATIFVVPLTGFAMDGFGTIFIMSTALFPALDPYIVIFFISGYRNALVKMFYKNYKIRGTSQFSDSAKGRPKTIPMTTGWEFSFDIVEYLMFGSLVSEEFCYKFSEISSAISCSSNLLLIYILARTHITHVGPYRILLLIFSVVDILVSLVHLLFIPAIHMTDFGYIYWSYRFLHSGTAAGTAAGVIFVLLFYQTFALLAFHYVYRYVTVCTPPWLSFMQLRPWRNWLVAAVAADIVVVGAMCLACCGGFLPNEVSREAYAPVLREVYNIDLLVDDKPGYLAIVFWVRSEIGEKEWVPWSLLIIVYACLVFFGTAAVMIVCTVSIIRNMNENSSTSSATMAPSTKRMQKQLFKTLLYQTIIPCITSYAPVAVIFLVPLTGIDLGGFGTIFIMSTVLFPALDPYIVLFLISGYRKALIGMFANICKRGPTTVIQISRDDAKTRPMTTP